MLIQVESKLRPIVLLDRRGYFELHSYIGSKKRRIARSFRELSRNMQSLITPDSMRKVIQLGGLQGEMRDGWTKMISGFVGDRVMPEHHNAIATASENIRKRFRASMKQETPSVMESAGIWVNEQGGTLIVNLTGAQMGNAQAVIHAQVIWGVTSPYQLAQMMKPMVGLTEREALACTKVYQGLISEGVSQREAVGQLERYANLLHRRRADRIARTELSNAYNFGQMNSVRGAIDEGLLTGEMEKNWIAGGANPCDICLENEAAGYIALDEAFPSGNDHPTTHPNDECSVGYRLRR